MRLLQLILFCTLVAISVGVVDRAFGDPLDQWTVVSSGTTNRLHSVSYGNGLFVACGDSGTLLRSLDGLTWAPATAGTTNSLFGIAFGAGRFVAVGQFGTVLDSTNGVEWSSRVSGTLNSLNAVAYTDFGFLAAGSAGTIVTSGDGTNWAIQHAATSGNFLGAGAGFGRTFLGAAVNPPALFWSTNGSTWSYMTNVVPSQQPDLFNGGFAYGNGVLLGVRIRGSFCRTTNGTDWTNYNSPFVYCFGLAFARNQFVTVGGNYSSGGRTIGSSTDGVSWKKRYYQSSEGRLLGVAYGRHRFVAVGDDGAILVSAPMLWLSNLSAVSGGLKMTVEGEPGGVYHIQTTTGIPAQAWTDVGVVTNSGPATEFDVPFLPGSSQQFYRVTSD